MLIVKMPISLYRDPTYPHNFLKTTHTGFNIFKIWAVPFSLAAT